MDFNISIDSDQSKIPISFATVIVAQSLSGTKPKRRIEMPFCADPACAMASVKARGIPNPAIWHKQCSFGTGFQ